MPSTPSRDPRFESDSTKTALMLLASHATQDGEAGMAAMTALIRAWTRSTVGLRSRRCVRRAGPAAA